MSEKSFVTLARRTCVACQKEYETGEILMNNMLKPVFEKYTNVGIGICDDCLKEAMNKDIVYMAELDRDKEFVTQVVGISRKDFREICTVEIPPDDHLVICEYGTISKISGGEDDNSGDVKGGVPEAQH